MPKKRKWIGQITPKSKKGKIERASENPDQRESRLKRMRVAAAAARSAENKEERCNRLKQMRVAVAALTCRQKQREIRLKKMRDSAAASITSENEEQWEIRLNKKEDSTAATRALEYEELQEIQYESNRMYSAGPRRSAIPSEFVLGAFNYVSHINYQNYLDVIDRMDGHCSSEEYKGEPSGICCNNGKVAVKEEPRSPATEDNLDDTVEDDHESPEFVPFEQVFVKDEHESSEFEHFEQVFVKEEVRDNSNTTVEEAEKQQSASSGTKGGNIAENIRSRFLKILGKESGTQLVCDAAPNVISEGGSQQLIDGPEFIIPDTSSSPCRSERLDASNEDPGPTIVPKAEADTDSQKEDSNTFVAVDEKVPLHECYKCGMQFPMRCVLNSHIRSHPLKKPLVCPMCHREFSKKSNLNAHVRIHSGPFACSVCNKQYVYKCNLDVHLRVHSGEKPYKCSICGKKYRDQDRLIRHYKTHSAARPYWCMECQIRFTQSNCLISHMKIHSEES